MKKNQAVVELASLTSVEENDKPKILFKHAIWDNVEQREDFIHFVSTVRDENSARDFSPGNSGACFVSIKHALAKGQHGSFSIRSVETFKNFVKLNLQNLSKIDIKIMKITVVKENTKVWEKFPQKATEWEWMKFSNIADFEKIVVRNKTILNEQLKQ
jgi:hypothetical protein